MEYPKYGNYDWCQSKFTLSPLRLISPKKSLQNIIKFWEHISVDFIS